MRFGLVEDYNNVLNGGPWFIGEHFLSIRRWEPNFKPANASCRLFGLDFLSFHLSIMKLKSSRRLEMPLAWFWELTQTQRLR